MRFEDARKSSSREMVVNVAEIVKEDPLIILEFSRKGYREIGITLNFEDARKMAYYILDQTEDSAEGNK